MQLFIIPAVLVLGGYLLNSQQTARQLATEEQRAENQLEAEEERTQQEALQQYNEMRSLILEEDLRYSSEGDAVRELARARTLGVLDNLDPDRKRIVVLFLRETSLLSSYDDTIVDLSGADLTDAYLREARLVNTSLGVQGEFLTPHDERTDLSGADLSRAILLGANLKGAILNGADLSGALVGTTDPNLPWHPKHADLEGVNLSNANLSGAELEALDLTETDLSGADLSGANLSGATVNEEQLDTVWSLQGATKPDGTEHE